ncbi:hypothetical protein Vretimale_7518 [Volvox reticuliferus]|uniref:Uncharacterized protein n=1 Tax=Volvox reticuliferus TaxID=1737510 RepID=A0A8J4G9P9_9CHLO|nr:hypothetical protein Vretifemale_7583 [Volvox reticuliferus]GIM02678.1 hypothetical protein Vretimale_7518 [Volvox reticuliferus]
MSCGPRWPCHSLGVSHHIVSCGMQLRLMGAGNGGVSGANGTTANGALGGSSGLGGGLGNAADDLGFENGSNKKARVVWSVEMHQQFVNAVNQLGIDKAVPKKILEIMNVDGLTRENVASHLQKYRLYLKRVSGVQQSAQNRAVKPPPPQQPQSPPGASQPQQQQQQQPLPASGPNGAAAGGGGAGQMPSGGGAAAALAGILGTGGPGGGGGGACPGGGAGPPPGGGSIGPDGGPPGVGLNPATIAGAMTATAGGFPPPPPPPHPAALLAANPMMAAAGLNPLLGPMGGLGVGPLGPLNPLNSMPMPGMQPPLGLLPGLPGGAGQPGLGPLGPMGLPGLGPLPSLPGGLPLNPMANGLQQMAAANLMQGMAGLGPLPPLSMNGLMGPLPGVGLPGPQQHLFPQQPQALQQQHQQQQQQQQLQQQQKDLLTVQKQQQAAIGAAVPLPHTQQQQQQPGLPQTVTVGTPSLANPTAAALLHQHTCGQHNNLSCSSPHPHHHHHQQQQQVLQSQHSPHLAANKHPLATVVLNGVVDSGGRGAHMHVGTGTHGSDPGGGVVGVLDIPPDMIGGLIEDSFGGVPSAGGQVTPGTGTAVLDPAMLLEESDNPDFAAVFQEMSSYGASSGNVGGSVAASVVMGQVLLPQPPIVDAVGGLGITSETARVDEDFLNLLFKS